MQFALFLCLAIVASAAANLANECDKNFSIFMSKFHVRYPNADEQSKRKSVFCENMKEADRLNELNGTPSFGVSKFSDRTRAEFSVLLGRKDMKKPVPTRPVRTPNFDGVTRFKANAAVVDWTAAGMVTPVKNQGQCGSCWAHSVTEQIESEWLLAGNAMWEFSVQQVTSCTTTTAGCGGGQTYLGFEYLMGIPESSGEGLGSGSWAPYIQSMTTECLGSSCTEACSNLDISILTSEAMLTGPLTTVSGYDYATPSCTIGKCSSQNVTLLAQNIASHGPASICVNAANWNMYTGGVMTEQACGGMAAGNIDHCVQLTGYNSEANPPYWIVRNSWATDWGVNGYIYLAFGENTCGLANEATFVTLGNAAYAGKNGQI